MTDDIKPRRTILYCTECKWAAEITGALIGTLTKCPNCARLGRSSVTFHEHEKARADDVLQMEIGKSVDDVAMYDAPPG